MMMSSVETIRVVCSIARKNNTTAIETLYDVYSKAISVPKREFTFIALFQKYFGKIKSYNEVISNYNEYDSFYANHTYMGERNSMECFFGSKLAKGYICI